MDSLFKGFEDLIKSYEDKELREDEYLDENGVICCLKCHTPREYIDDTFPFRPRCLCKCQGEKVKRQDEIDKRKDHFNRFECLQRYSSIQRDYAKVSFDNTTLQGRDESFINAFNRCKKYVEIAEEVKRNGYGIYLYGEDSGIGKTHLINCIANKLKSQYYPVLVLSESDILKAIKETFGYKTDETEKSVIDKLVSIDFLFIDDLGTETYNYGNEAKWIQGKMYDIIDRRYNSKKPTIFSSNNSIPELISTVEIMKKTVDRIVGCSNVVLNIKGESMRKIRRKKDIPF